VIPSAPPHCSASWSTPAGGELRPRKGGQRGGRPTEEFNLAEQEDETNAANT
jgi:hypothetical protein